MKTDERQRLEGMAQHHLKEALRLAVELARPEVLEIVRRTSLAGELEARGHASEAFVAEAEEIAKVEEGDKRAEWEDVAAKRRAVAARLLERAASMRVAAADRYLLEAQHEAAQAEAELQAVRHLASVTGGGAK